MDLTSTARFGALPARESCPSCNCSDSLIELNIKTEEENNWSVQFFAGDGTQVLSRARCKDPECNADVWFCLPCMGKFRNKKACQKHCRKTAKHAAFLLRHSKNNDEDDDHDVHDDDSATDIPPVQPNEENVPIGESERISPVGRDVRSEEDISRGFDPSSNSPTFFHYLHNHSAAAAAKYVVAKAFERPDPNILTEEEAKFHLIAAQFATEITSSQRKTLAYLLQQAAVSKDRDLSIFSQTRVPVTEGDFHDFYLTKKAAILPNLPHPAIKTTADGSHAYVSLKEVIAHMLAMGRETERFYFREAFGTPDDDVSGNSMHNHGGPDYVARSTLPTVSSTPAARDLFMELVDNGDGEFTYYLWVKVWRDDFDPSHTKSSRNQVWVWTNTISDTARSNGCNTFFMAISAKGDDHSGMEELFAKEIAELSKEGAMFYHGGIKRMIRVKVGFLMTCVDRPERTTIYSVGDHNGTYSALWGHACSVDASRLDNNLPSCWHCRAKRATKHSLSFTSSSSGTTAASSPSLASSPDPGQQSTSTLLDEDDGECEAGQCSNWNVLNESFTCAVKLTVPWMKEVLRFAHHHVATKPPPPSRKQSYWTKDNLIAYLRTCAVTPKIMDLVYNTAKDTSSNGSVDKLLESLPAFWSIGDNAFQHAHLGPMHMLFLGNGKGGHELLNKWLSTHKRLATYGKQANKVLSDVQACRLRKFFNAHPLSTSKWGTGTWVSENYLCFCRMSKYLCSLPALDPKDNDSPKYQREAAIVSRFLSALNLCMGRLMAKEETISDVHECTWMPCFRALSMSMAAELPRGMRRTLLRARDKNK